MSSTTRPFVAALLIAAAACSKTSTTEEATKPVTPRAPATGAEQGSLDLTSAAFAEGGTVPSRFTCQGQDGSPPLAWRDPPAGTKSFAVVVDDPDAPDPKAPKQTFVHWVLYDLPADTRSLPEGTTAPPQGARAGKNDFGKTTYGGPCPPVGRHRYFFKVYALDTVMQDIGEPTAPELMKKIEGHILARGQLMGTYEKGAGPRT